MSPSTSPPAPSQVVCQDLAALRASMKKLSPAELKASDAATVSAELAEIKTALTTLADDAHGQWDTQISAMKSALAGLQAQVKNLADQPSSENLAAVRAAAGQVAATGQQLFSLVTARCPAASPSPAP
jgi:hypothetical protein